MKSRAVMALAPWRVELVEIVTPHPGPRDVVVDLDYSWISNGTEGSFIRGERIAGDTPWREGDPSPFPHVPGYQSVGRVRALGDGVTGLTVGQTVFVAVGHVADCFFDYGGHLSPIVADYDFVWALPDGLDPLAASGAVLTQVGLNAGLRPEVHPHDAAVVIGDGLVGHWAAQTLRHRGARVAMVGHHPDRLQLAPSASPHVTFNPRDVDLISALTQWAPEGIQAVVHTAGPVAGIEALYPQMRRFGHVVSAGFVGPDGAMDVQRMRDPELTLHAVAGWTRDRVTKTLEWLAAGHLQSLPLITHRFPVAQATDAYDLVLHRREPFLGVVLDWSPTL